MKVRRMFGLLLAALALTLTACSLVDVVPDDLAPEQGEGSPGEAAFAQGPDLAAAAESLGIAEDDLRAALGDPQEGPPDFAAVATELGVTEDALREALGIPEDGEGAPHDGEGPSLDASGVSSSRGL